MQMLSHHSSLGNEGNSKKRFEDEIHSLDWASGKKQGQGRRKRVQKTHTEERTETSLHPTLKVSTHGIGGGNTKRAKTV